ncbi:hypothetical protein AB0L00_05220 [Actinoallomurus sp. NPDC052308]|uniref:hypothetical protein n=1 Tax=Actinoallomurus sp. NPDC052308 TaxID=3155530 RepID=UPI00341352FC
MRRIATLVATGAVAAAAAIALAAGPASADTKSMESVGSKAELLKAGSQPQVSATAVATPYSWATSGSSGVTGAAAKGRWGHYTSKGKKKIKITITLKDTAPRDGKYAGFEVKNPNTGVIHKYYATAAYATGTKYYFGTYVYVREALVGSDGSFTPAKGWKKVG